MKMNPSVVTIDENNASTIPEKGEQEDRETEAQPTQNQVDKKSRGLRQHYMSVPPAGEGGESPELKQPEKQKIRDNAQNMIDGSN